jgi:hypothetical protein
MLTRLECTQGIVNKLWHKQTHSQLIFESYQILSRVTCLVATSLPLLPLTSRYHPLCIPVRYGALSSVNPLHYSGFVPIR